MVLLVTFLCSTADTNFQIKKPNHSKRVVKQLKKETRKQQQGVEDEINVNFLSKHVNKNYIHCSKYC